MTCTHSQTNAILFDLDGTLLDTVPDIHAAILAMLDELTLPLIPIEATRTYIGKGIKNLIRRVISGSLGEYPESTLQPKALELFSKHYAKHNGQQTTIYPGAIEGLEAIKAEGIPMALITNKSHAFTEPLIKQMKLNHYFHTVVSGDMLPKPKPDPMALIWACGSLNVLPQQTLFIGDSINDFEAGKAAGCTVFLVPYGYNEGRSVQDLPCDAIVPDINAAVRLIKSQYLQQLQK